MAEVVSIALVGFFLGMRHATDPDHVIAVTTIVSRERSIRRAAGIGVLWGLGHTVTICAVGGAILLFDLVIPPRVGLTMEISVAVMLILLGAFNLVSFARGTRETLSGGRAHAHRDPDGDEVHGNFHGHGLERHGHFEDTTALARMDRWFGRLSFYQLARSLAVGVVHGLAGSAAVALLVLATIRDARWGVVYLSVFGVGTIAGMMVITAALSLPFAYAHGRVAGLHRSLGFTSGLLSLAFGLFLVYQIGLVDGLFSGEPHWTPR